jgi:hypothetical protein
MDLNHRLSDVVIDGTIIDYNYNYISNLMEGILSEEEIMEEWGFVPAAVSTSFTVKINEVINGEFNEKYITFRMFGGHGEAFTKPNIEDNVVLFLSRQFGGDDYVTATGEHSIFTYDEKGRLYSFSNTEEISSFDGRNKTELFEVVRSSEVFNPRLNLFTSFS